MRESNETGKQVLKTQFGFLLDGAQMGEQWHFIPDMLFEFLSVRTGHSSAGFTARCNID
jgi:hypothetical protein